MCVWEYINPVGNIEMKGFACFVRSYRLQETSNNWLIFFFSATEKKPKYKREHFTLTEPNKQEQVLASATSPLV